MTSGFYDILIEKNVFDGYIKVQLFRCTLQVVLKVYLAYKNPGHIDLSPKGTGYTTIFRSNIIANTKKREKLGIEEFLRNENIRWTCIECGGTICGHKGNFYNCGRKV